MTKLKTCIRRRLLSAIAFLCLFAAGFLTSFTVQAASSLTDSTQKCLKMLDSLGEEKAEQFIGLDRLEITDEQYEIIRNYTLDLTQGCKDTSSKIRTVYDYITSYPTPDVGPDCPDDLNPNAPYAMFKNSGTVCQGFANLFRTMMTALDIPCINVHGFVTQGSFIDAGHAWNYVYCDGHWKLVDCALLLFYLDDLSVAFQKYTTSELEQTIYMEGDFEFSYYDGGLSVIGYRGDADEIMIPESCHDLPVVGVHPCSAYAEYPLQDSTARKIVIPASIEHGILATVADSGREFEQLFPFQSPALKEIEVDEANPVYASYKGILYDKAYSRILSIPAAITDIELKPLEFLDKNTLFGLSCLRTLEIAEGTRSISAFAIESCPSLERISIPDSVTEIQEDAFYNCSTDFTVYASEGSAAAEFAAGKGLTVEEPQAFELADYTSVDEALHTVPSDLTKYTDETVQNLQNAIHAVNRNLTFREQDTINAAADAIRLAVENLKEKGTDDTQTPPSTDTKVQDTQTPPPADTQVPPPTTIPVTDTATAPKKVTGLKVSYKKTGKAILSWKKLKSVTGYEIRRFQNGRWVKFKTLKNKAKLTIKRNAKKTYQYKVRAYKKAGTKIYYGTYSRKIKIRKR